MSSVAASDREKIRTLVFVQQDNQILLGLKKRGFGAGRWNGFGGKCEPGETIAAAAVRELYEEAQLHTSSLTQQGILTFYFADNSLELQIHVFRVNAFTGTPQETEEMTPRWFACDAIPYDTMWADDRHWLPLFLAGTLFRGFFHFQDIHTLLTHELYEDTSIPHQAISADHLAVLSPPRPSSSSLA